MTSLVLRDQEHEPNSYDIKDEIISKDGRHISIPNLRIIEVKLKTIHWEETTQSRRYQCDKGEVWGCFETENIGVQEYRKKDGVYYEKDSVD